MDGISTVACRNSCGAVLPGTARTRQRPRGARTFELMTEREGDVLWMHLAGRLGYTVADAFEQAMSNAIEETDRVLILDLGKADSVDSAGLRVILMSARVLQSRGARLALCAPSDNLRKMFAVMGLERLLRIYATKAEARATPGA